MIKLFRTIGLPLLATVIAVIFIAYQHQSARPRKATWDDTLREAQNGGYRLITTQQLWDLYHSQKDKILLVDTRQDWEYRTGHIKGAKNFPMEPTWISRLTRRSEMREFLGPDQNRTIVFY